MDLDAATIERIASRTADYVLARLAPFFLAVLDASGSDDPVAREVFLRLMPQERPPDARA